ncbi:MAG: hypothetical protein V3R25_05810 [Nitrosomonadaceae bacterium]
MGYRIIEEEEDLQGFRIMPEVPGQGVSQPLPDVGMFSAAGQQAQQAFRDVVGTRPGFDDPSVLQGVRDIPVVGGPLAALSDITVKGLEGVGGLAAGAGTGLASIGGDIAAALSGEEPGTMRRAAVSASEDPALALLSGNIPAAAAGIPLALSRAAGTSKKIAGAPRAVKPGKVWESTQEFVNKKIDKIAPPEKILSDQLELAFTGDKMTPDVIRQRAMEFQQRTGRPATLLDISGDNTKQLFSTAGREIGEGREVLENYRKTKLANQTQTVQDIAEGTLTKNKRNYFEEIGSLERQMKSVSSELYDAAHAETVTLTDDFSNILNSNFGRQAIDNAQEILRLEKGESMSDLGLVGNVRTGYKFSDEVSVKLLDYVKRGMDDVIEGYRDPTTQVLNLNATGRAQNKAKIAFLQSIDEASPTYKAARDAYAGPASFKTALTDGRNIFKTKQTPEMIKERMAGLGQSEKDLYRSGAMRAMMDKMQSGIVDSNRIREFVKKENVQDRLTALFDGDAQMSKRFIDQLEAEAEQIATLQRVSPNIGSQTVRELSGQRAFGIPTKGNVAQDLIARVWNNFRSNRSLENRQIVNKEIADLAIRPIDEEFFQILAQMKGN